MELLDLNSENKAEKKGIANDIYLNKNAETGLAAALLEPSLNEGVMRSEDSNKEESKYVVIDIVQEREEEVDPLIRCCSCVSFFIPLGSCFNLFRIFGKKHEEDSQKPSLAAAPCILYFLLTFFSLTVSI
ncbi:Hypothetical predicted protein [Olea europaea subsp. europaea]|uniref:Uncharacterized protein n=1 Tax=Olea europaea subsp. europaea TaxID=158383 RepID=A0A8S0RBP4_OLEEU|nr:Hypothetical predicted protein [Olea europaea subsp. europaea]